VPSCFIRKLTVCYQSSCFSSSDILPPSFEFKAVTLPHLPVQTRAYLKLTSYPKKTQLPHHHLSVAIPIPLFVDIWHTKFCFTLFYPMEPQQLITNYIQFSKVQVGIYIIFSTSIEEQQLYGIVYKQILPQLNFGYMVNVRDLPSYILNSTIYIPLKRS
jgi:hypothetical protein